MVTTFDFSPLFRTAIGFDRMSRALEAANRVEDGTLSYPPYNIEQLDDEHYQITMAVAGFNEDDLEIELHQGTLNVKGRGGRSDDEGRAYLYRGIANRSFERRFQLAEHIKVTGAGLQNGLLRIDLERDIPEQLKPRKIEIGAAASRQIEGKAE